MSENGRQEAMERYRSGGMTPEEKLRFEGEILAHDALSDELYDDISLETSFAESAHRPARGLRGAVLWLLPLATAALLVLAVQLQRAERNEIPVLRGSGPSVELLDPVGPQDTAPSFFRWRRDPQAAAYRFELVDSEAVPVLSSVVTDTFWTPKGSAVEVPVSGSWHITPLDELMMDLGPSSTASYRTRP